MKNIKLAVKTCVLFFASLVLLLPLSANSALMTWVLEDVVFDDGGVATGFFSYDYDTSYLASWNITTSSGNTEIFPSFNYTPDTSSAYAYGGDEFEFYLDDETERWLYLETDDDLDGSVVDVPLDYGEEYVEYSNGCYYEDVCDYGYRETDSGRLLAKVDDYEKPVDVPEPASLFLLGAGLLGMAGVSRRRAGKRRNG